MLCALANLRQRRLEPEVMDRPDLDQGQHTLALRGLSRLNAASGSARILWRPVRAELTAARGEERRPLRLLDVATGGGDVPLRLARRARRAGLPVQIAGCDVSSHAVACAAALARQQGAAASEVSFFQLDAIRDDLPDDFDVLTTSLFLHHLEEEQAVALLRRMAAAARSLVLVSDLVRCAAGYALAYAATRLLSRSSVVHTDGPRSVAGAFTVVEVEQLARRAGLAGATVARRWPFRFLLAWRKPS